MNTAQPPAQQAQQEHAPGAERDPANSGFDGYGTDKINDPGLPRAPGRSTANRSTRQRRDEL